MAVYCELHYEYLGAVHSNNDLKRVEGVFSLLFAYGSGQTLDPLPAMRSSEIFVETI